MNRPRSLTYAAVLAVALAAATLLTGAGPSRDPSALPTRGALVPPAFTRVSSPTPLPGYALQVGDVVLVTCPAFLVVDQDVHQVRVRCARDGTATPTASVSPSTVTNTPSPTSSATASVTSTPASTSSATPTVTQTPRVTVTATPSPTSPSDHALALGIRLNGDQSVTDWWNAHALPIDEAHGGKAVLREMLRVSVGSTMFLASSASAADVDAAIASAKVNGWRTIDVNDEGPDCAQLATDEAMASAKIRAAGLRFSWAPTGVKLESCTPSDVMVSPADGIFYQAQRLEYTDPNLAASVHAQIHRLRVNHPGYPVTVQLSVNPPTNATANVADVIGWIQAVADGSADAPDRVSVFYRMNDAGRIAAMEQVIQAFRP